MLEAPDDSGVSDTEQREYAAVRFYRNNKHVHIIPINKIKDFHRSRKDYPYDAFITTDTNEFGQEVFEPGSVLEVSDDRSSLHEHDKRWPKPNKRYSDVIHELTVKERILKVPNAKKTSTAISKTTASKSKPTPPIPFEQAQKEVEQNVQILEQKKLNFHHEAEMIAAKDRQIAHLMELVEKLKRSQNVPDVDGLSPAKTHVPKISSKVDVPQSGESIANWTSLNKTPILKTPVSANYSQVNLLNARKFRETMNQNSDPLATPETSSKSPYHTTDATSTSTLNKHVASNSKQQDDFMFLNNENDDAVGVLNNDKISSSHKSCHTGAHASPLRLKRKRSHSSMKAARKQAESNRTKRQKTAVDKTCEDGTVTDKKKDKNEAAKPKKKMIYKRKTPTCLYDSDEYEKSNLEKRPRLTAWKQEMMDEETNQMVKKEMFHIHYAVSVPRRSWNKALKAKNSYGFIRQLWPHIFGDEEFYKMAVQIDRTLDMEDRIPVDGRKFEALKKGYTQFLFHKSEIKKDVTTKQEEKSRARRINKFGRELGIIIAQHRAATDSFQEAGLQEERRASLKGQIESDSFNDDDEPRSEGDDETQSEKGDHETQSEQGDDGLDAD